MLVMSDVFFGSLVGHRGHVRVRLELPAGPRRCPGGVRERSLEVDGRIERAPGKGWTASEWSRTLSERFGALSERFGALLNGRGARHIPQNRRIPEIPDASRSDVVLLPASV